MVGAKKVYKWWKSSTKGFLSFSLFYLMLTLILPRINKFIPIIEKRRKKRKCLIFRFRCNDKIYLLTRIILHNFVVLEANNFWVFISYTVHRNKLTDMFINKINRAINKNLNLFFFPSDIKLAWKAKQKQRQLTKNQLFLFLCCFFLKIRDIRK